MLNLHMKCSYLCLTLHKTVLIFLINFNFQIESIAQTYRKTPEQILLRYQIQRGHIAIPISISKIKLKENMDIFKFELKSHDMAALGKLDRNKNYSSLNALSYVNPFSYIIAGKKIMFCIL